MSYVDAPKAVPVDGLPGVYVRESDFAQVLAYFDAMSKAKEDVSAYVRANTRLFIGSVCDESANLRYTDADADKLSKLPHRVATALVKAISNVNGLNSRTVEAEAKNS